MKAAKSEGGISSGRFRNGESAYRLWVQTLSHMAMLNRLSLDRNENKTIHRDLAAAQRKVDERAISSISTWLDEM